MTPYALGLLRFRYVVLLVLGTVSAYFCMQIIALDVRVNADAILPQTHPFVTATNRIEALFGGKNQTIIGIVPRSGTVYEPAELASIRRITEGLLLVPGVIPSQVLSLTATKAKAISGSPGGLEVRPFVERGESPGKIKELVQQNSIYQGSTVSRDGSIGVILADFRQNHHWAAYRSLFKAVRDVVEPERTEGRRIVLAGIAVSLAWLEIYSQQMLWLFFVALAVVMAVLYLSFRSLQGMLIPTCTGLLSAAWALGIMSLAGVSLDLANVTTPILIMSVAAGHSVQMLKRYYEEYSRFHNNHKAVVASLVKIGPVMMTAGAIATISFLSLLTFEIASIRVFGLFTACGILSALILEMTFVPALRACLPPRRGTGLREERQRDWIDLSLSRVARLIRERHCRLIFVSFGAGIAILALGATFIEVNNSMMGNFKRHSEIWHDNAVLNARMAGTNTLNILVEGPVIDSIKEPTVLDAMQQTQRRLEQYDQVGKTVSIADYLTRMNQALHDEDPQAARLPETRDLIGQYLLLYSAAGDPRDFDALVDDQYRFALLTAFLRTDSTAYIERLIRDITAFAQARFPPQYRLSIGGGITQGVALNEIMVRGKILNILQIGVIIGLLSSLIFRSLTAGVLTLIPLALAVLANFGVMGLAGIRLDIGTSVVAAMAVGIGADYSIYLLYRLREECWHGNDLQTAIDRTLLTAGKAVIYVALSVGLGYAVLAISGLQFHVRMGVLVAVTMAASCLGAVVLLPACVARWSPAFLTRHRAD